LEFSKGFLRISKETRNSGDGAEMVENLENALVRGTWQWTIPYKNEKIIGTY
jgi:hypothetical protein